MKKILLSTFALLSINYSGKLSAQCTAGSTGGTNVTAASGFTWAQSFTATCTGQLDSVQFIANMTGTCSAGTLNIYPGSQVTGSIYNQPFGAIPTTPGSPIRVVLTGAVPIVSGNQYTFEFFVNVDVFATFADVYAGGVAFENGVAYPGVDFDFNVYISPPSGGMNSAGPDGAVKLFPNPASDIFTIDLGANHTGNGTVTVFSADGQRVRDFDITEQTISIDVAELTGGIYFVHIATGGKSYSQKIIIK